MKCAKNSHCTLLLAVFRAPLADPFMVEFDMINSPGKAAISSLINENSRPFKKLYFGTPILQRF